MRQRKKTALTVLYLIITAIILTSCSLPLLGGKSAEDVGVSAAVNTGMNLNSTDNNIAVKVIKDFLAELYKGDLDAYATDASTGKIADSLKKFMLQDTIDEFDGKPEAPFNYPRYIDLNGMTMLQYKPVQYKGTDGKDTPEIDCGFVGMQGNIYLYYVKCILDAECIPSSEFDKAYIINSTGTAYTKTGMVNQSLQDEFKVQTFYDIGMVKGKIGEMKVVSFTESNIKPGLKIRLSRLNNDVATRIPYLTLMDDSKVGIHANADDQKVFNQESQFIKEYFERLTAINRSRMDILQSSWNKSKADFSKYIGSVKTTVGGKEDIKKLTDVMQISDDYKDRFDIASYPLLINLLKIDKFKDFSIVAHPAYSKNVKKYILRVTADVEEKNGMPSSTTSLVYDYFVTLSGSGDSLKVAEMRMNEYYSADIN